MGLKQVHLFVRGRVQGVFFRASAQREAKRLGVTGWVKNRPDGTVEILGEGEEDALKALSAWANHGPTAARVERVEVRREDAPAVERAARLAREGRGLPGEVVGEPRLVHVHARPDDDRPAGRLDEQARHLPPADEDVVRPLEANDGLGRQAAPDRVGEREGQQGGLAGTGRRDQHRGAPVPHGRHQVGQHGADRQVRPGGIGTGRRSTRLRPLPFFDDGIIRRESPRLSCKSATSSRAI